MSELERERHKNVGLERARDSWYQEYCKAFDRIVKLEADLAEATEHPKTVLTCAACQKIAVVENCALQAERDALRDRRAVRRFCTLEEYAEAWLIRLRVRADDRDEREGGEE